MNLNALIKLSYLVEQLSQVTDVTIPDIVSSLEGVCWNEEEGGRIKNYHQEEEN